MDGTKFGIKHLVIFICDWVIFHFFLHFLIFFFRINFFEKFFQEHYQSVNVLSGLILVQTVCKSYQQTTLGDKELKDMLISTGTCIHLK